MGLPARRRQPFGSSPAGSATATVVCRELFSCGYVANRAIWDMAEARDGATARWLGSTARRLGIYLGAGVAETDGSDFFNAFILAGPDGQIAGRAYKANRGPLLPSRPARQAAGRLTVEEFDERLDQAYAAKTLKGRSAVPLTCPFRRRDLR